MRLGWKIIIGQSVAILALSAATSVLIGERLRKQDEHERKVAELEVDKAGLAAAISGRDKLGIIALRLGTEPVRISGNMWVVVEGEVGK